MKSKFFTLLMGIWFGIVLVKGQLVSWQQINDMFHFESAYMYLVIASAVVVGAISVALIRRFEPHTIDGEVIEITKKPFHKGLVFGGTLFGMGWAITGACPGPIYAQIGSGTLLAVVTFIGALAGMYLYAILQPKLPHNSWNWSRAKAQDTSSAT
ncbi:MAG: YeeE/YedE family protein [Anaerolineae bacterium]|nr:YeeE/YedE family protein [Anaerolineae bacterium]